MKKKALAASQADDNMKKRKLEPEELGRGGDLVKAASGPNMEVEEDWFPPPADDEEDMELSGKEHGLRIGEPFELIAQDLVEAQAMEKKPARQSFPTLPQWMFTGAGRLKAAAPEWKHQEGVWAVRLGARILTEEQEAGYLLAFEDITKKPFFMGRGLREAAGTEARGSASSS